MDISLAAWSTNGSGSPGKATEGPVLEQFSSAQNVTLALLMALLMLATIVGNALVMLAFAVDSSLRTQNNYFLLNLAISDFLVGAFCIPLYVPYELTKKWTFGRSICKLWLVIDYLLCTASAFNIVLISYDRFLSVTRAVAYRAHQGDTRQALFKMVMVWVSAFLLYGPAIITWEYIFGRRVLKDNDCQADFNQNWYFLITASTIEFFTPFISSQSFVEEIEMSPQTKLSVKCCQEDHGDAPCLHAPKWDAEEENAKDSANKVAKSLAIIVGIFGLCWAPYTLLMIIRAACHDTCIPDPLYKVSFWLLWINSAINPILYPLCHYSFRRAFVKLLCPKKLKIQPRNSFQKCWK
uniref:Histamine H3 receptor n=1 Tax=Salvator merianae TaxID=96440 RepID=A0A8D0C9Z4_SALMN